MILQTLHVFVAFLLIYVAYALVVIIGRYIRKRNQSKSSQSTTSAEQNLGPALGERRYYYLYRVVCV